MRLPVMRNLFPFDRVLDCFLASLALLAVLVTT